jgi:hypothetical protein
LTTDFPAVPKFHHQNYEHGVLNLIDNPVVSDPDAVELIRAL